MPSTSCQPNYPTELPYDCLRVLAGLIRHNQLASRWREAAHAAYAVWGYLQPIVLSVADGPLRVSEPFDDEDAGAQIEALLDTDQPAALSEQLARQLLNWLLERILARLGGMG